MGIKVDFLKSIMESASNLGKGIFNIGQAAIEITEIIKEGKPINIKIEGPSEIIELLEKGKIKIKKKVKKPMDAHRKKVMSIIEKMRADGETFDKIAIFLQKEKFQTFSNRGKWHAQTVHRLYQDHILP